MPISQEKIQIIQSFLENLPLYKTNESFKIECDQFIEAIRGGSLEMIKKELKDVIKAIPEERREELKNKINEALQGSGLTVDEIKEAFNSQSQER